MVRTNWESHSIEHLNSTARNWKIVLLIYLISINIADTFLLHVCLFTVALHKHPNGILIIKQKKQKVSQNVNG